MEVEVPDDLTPEQVVSWLDNLEIWIGNADIKDCFLREKITRKLARYFCLEPLTAREANVFDIDGVSVEASELVWPCLSSLAPGFSWALYFAQKRGGKNQLNDCGIAPSTLMRDRGAPVVIREGMDLHSYLYVDNLGRIGF